MIGHREMLRQRQVASTKAVGTAAEDYDEIVAPSGRHGFREEVASNLSKSLKREGARWKGIKRLS